MQQKGQEAPSNHQLFTDEVFIISAQCYILSKQMYFLARTRCHSHGTRRKHKPQGRKRDASLPQLRRMSERWYSSKILSHTDLVQQVCPSTESEGVETNHVCAVFDRYVRHAAPSGKSVGCSHPYSSAPVIPPHQRAWTAAKDYLCLGDPLPLFSSKALKPR